jgi:hypothetical protein
MWRDKPSRRRLDCSEEEMARWRVIRRDVEGIVGEYKEVESQKRVVFAFLVLQIMSVVNRIG